MELKITADTGDLMRFEEKGGACITFKLRDNSACILSVFVPEDERREGMGSVLINLAEREAELRGARMMEADLADTVPGLYEFLDEMGYSVSRDDQVMSVDIKKLLTRPRRSGGTFVTLAASRSAFATAKEMMKRDLDGINMNMSGVLYDRQKTVGVILCSEDGGDILLQYMVVTDGSSDSTMSLFSGFLDNIIDLGGTMSYRTLSFFDKDDGIGKAIKEFAGDENIFIPKCHVDYAIKALSYNDNEYEYEEACDGKSDELWKDEAATIPYQRHIMEKAYFSRKVAGYYDGIVPAKSLRELLDEIEAEVDSVSDIPDEVILPWEDEPYLPFDMEFSYHRKDPDTHDPDIFIIGRDNIKIYGSYFEPNVAQNLMRKQFFAMGLRERSEGLSPVAVVAWEMRREKSGRVCAIRHFLSSENDAASERLMAAYDLVLSDMKADGKMEAEKPEWISFDAINTADNVPDCDISGVIPLYHLTEEEYDYITENLMANSGSVELSDIDTIPGEWFDVELSCVKKKDNGDHAVLLAHRLLSGDIYIDLLYARGDDAKETKRELWKFFAGAYLKLCPPGVRVCTRLDRDEINI